MEERRIYTRFDLERAKQSAEFAPEGGYSLDDYTEMLVLSPEDFRDKLVLNEGAGSALKLDRELRARGVHSRIVSFSPSFDNPNARATMRQNNAGESTPEVVAGMGEELSFADNTFDMISIPERPTLYSHCRPPGCFYQAAGTRLEIWRHFASRNNKLVRQKFTGRAFRGTFDRCCGPRMGFDP